MPKLSQDYGQQLGELEQDFGLEPVSESYSAENFGNASIELKGPLVWIRIIRDRGQVFMDIAKPASKWVDFSNLLEAQGLHPRPGEALSLAEYVKALKLGRARVLGAIPTM